MKKLISMVMVVAMFTMGGITTHCNETATTLKNGKVEYASPGYKNPEYYIGNVTLEGDMILDLETDGSIYIQVVDESGRFIAPKEYAEKTEYGTNAGKDSVGGYYLTYVNSNTTKVAKANFVYNVKPGSYSIVLKSMHGQLCSVKLTPKFPDEIVVTLDGKKIEFDQSPIILNGRTLVPVRAIFEALGASVEWDNTTETVIVKRKNTTISLTIGNNVMQKNNKDITLDVAPQLLNSRTLVPARAVAEAFECKVDWDNSTSTVIIHSK